MKPYYGVNMQKPNTYLPKQISEDIETFMEISGMFEDASKYHKNQCKQFFEEMFHKDELLDSVKAKNVIGTLDGIGDTGFVEHSLLLLEDIMFASTPPTLDNVTPLFKGVIEYLGLHYDEVNACIQEVSTSNLSKFDTTEDEAKATVAKYIDLGIQVDYVLHAPSKLYYTVSLLDQVDKNNKSYHKGKIVKSLTRYKEPCFNKVIDQFPRLLKLFDSIP